jgi:hypothetical protein
MDSSLHVSSPLNASRLRVTEQAQTETQNDRFHSRICFIDQAFVDHLHSCSRQDSNKQPAVHHRAAATVSHQGPNNFRPKWIPEIISSMMHTATVSQHQRALAQRMGTLGTHSTLRIHLAADSGHWNRNKRMPRSYSSLDSKDKIPGPKTAWEVCTIS